MVDYHARFAVGRFFHLAYRGNIHRDVLAGSGLGVESCQLGGLGNGVIGNRSACTGDDHVAAVNLLGVEPEVVLSVVKLMKLVKV